MFPSIHVAGVYPSGKGSVDKVGVNRVCVNVEGMDRELEVQ